MNIISNAISDAGSIHTSCNRNKYRSAAPVLIGITVFLVIVFWLFSFTPVTANAGDHAHMKSYETYLVCKGDSLESIARTNSSRLSSVSVAEYIEKIRELNNFSSDYLVCGSYIFLPNYLATP